MRIRDWSSDVCSSDLIGGDAADHGEVTNLCARLQRARQPGEQHALLCIGRAADDAEAAIDARMRPAARRREGGVRRRRPEIGRASCRARGGMEAVTSVDAVYTTKYTDTMIQGT